MKRTLPIWMLAAWCELRRDFRSFRLDRMEELAVLDDVFVPEPGRMIEDFLSRGFLERSARV